METEDVIAISSVIIAAAAFLYTIYKSYRDEKYRLLSIKPRLSIEVNTIDDSFDIIICNHGAGHAIGKDLALINLKSKQEIVTQDDLRKYLRSWFNTFEFQMETYTLNKGHISSLGSGEKILFISIQPEKLSSQAAMEDAEKKFTEFTNKHAVYINCSDMMMNEFHHFISVKEYETKARKSDLSFFKKFHVCAWCKLFCSE